MTLRFIEVSRVIPTLNSANSLTIPLTFFDLPWLLFQPSKVAFFYKLTESTHEHFYSIIIPKLKLSLSTVLKNYLPLMGRITWNPSEQKPNILISPNDAISLTIMETDADFTRLSGYGQRPISELHTLFPPLPVSNDSASVFALQITLFPNQGFSIGVVAHHAVLDGKTLNIFLKTWAHICKLDVDSLPENLTPSFDRSLLRNKNELDEEMIEILKYFKPDKTMTRSLNPLPAKKLGDDVVLATLVLSHVDVKRLRERVISQHGELHLSTFIIAYAYVWTCLVKARGGQGERSVSLFFVADLRDRLDTPLPATYFGNCLVLVGDKKLKAGDFSDENGFVKAVETLSNVVKGLSTLTIEMVANAFAFGFKAKGESTQYGSIAGSSRADSYHTDFGWGKPVKVDIVSIDQGEAISLVGSLNEPGGVEIGLCLKKTEMDMVLSLFNNGL